MTDIELAREERALDLIANGYYIVHPRRGIIGCFPRGKSGITALSDARALPHWSDMTTEEEAGEEYLRTYAFGAGLWLELSPDAFKAFIKAGGRHYNSRKGVK